MIFQLVGIVDSKEMGSTPLSRNGEQMPAEDRFSTQPVDTILA